MKRGRNRSYGRTKETRKSKSTGPIQLKPCNQMFIKYCLVLDAARE